MTPSRGKTSPFKKIFSKKENDGQVTKLERVGLTALVCLHPILLLLLSLFLLVLVPVVDSHFDVNEDAIRHSRTLESKRQW